MVGAGSGTILLGQIRVPANVRRSKAAASVQSLALFLLLLLHARRAPAQAVQAQPTEAKPGPSSTNTSLAVAPPPDLSPFRGRPVSRVEVLSDDDTWSNVAIPEVRSV